MPDIVGYNNTQEQSIKDYSLINTSSSISLGQANTVYGINEPKIIQDTSIVGGGGGTLGVWFRGIGTASARVTPDAGQTFRIREIESSGGFEMGNYGITIPSDGMYSFNVFVKNGNSNTGTCELIISRYQGGSQYISQQILYITGVIAYDMTGAALYRLYAGDEVRVMMKSTYSIGPTIYLGMFKIA